MENLSYDVLSSSLLPYLDHRSITSVLVSSKIIWEKVSKRKGGLQSFWKRLVYKRFGSGVSRKTKREKWSHVFLREQENRDWRPIALESVVEPGWMDLHWRDTSSGSKTARSIGDLYYSQTHECPMVIHDEVVHACGCTDVLSKRLFSGAPAVFTDKRGKKLKPERSVGILLDIMDDHALVLMPDSDDPEELRVASQAAIEGEKLLDDGRSVDCEIIELCGHTLVVQCAISKEIEKQL